MNQQQVDKLKKNDKGLYALSKEEQAFLRGNCQSVIVYSNKGWKNNIMRKLYDNYIYRLDESFELPAKRWFLDIRDGLAFLPDNPSIFVSNDDWIEIPESELEYWENKPEGEWEIRMPKRGVRFLNPKSMRECLSSADSSTYRWCRPLKDRFDVMAEGITALTRKAGVDEILIACYLRNNLEKEIT